jgi:hypothetical protein
MTFVETIIREFDENPEIVLHIEEVRNFNKRFYPFNYPTIKEVIGSGCPSWSDIDNKPFGLLMDERDRLHNLNYGACFCALKEDLIRIGGADECDDYTGHICGPYEMTFRLVNAGKREKWHPTHFIYHVWHPGEGGDGNVMSQHDNLGMSTTAMEAKNSGRILPIIENPKIKKLRLSLKISHTDCKGILFKDCIFSNKSNLLKSISFCIISSGENEGMLTKVVESIHGQSIPEYEVLICGVSAGRAGVKVYPHPEWVQNRELAKMRNYLCEKAQYETIVLLCEKSMLSSDWYENIKNIDNFDIAGCRIVDLNGNRWLDWGKCSRVDLNEDYSLLDYEEWHPDAFINGDFMILRKSVWERIKFRENLTGGKRDDIDLCHRASNAGFNLRIFSNAVIIYQDIDLSSVEKNSLIFVDLLCKQGIDSLRNKEYFDAVSFFESAEEIKPSFVAGYHLGIAYWKFGEPEKAEKKWQEVAERYDKEKLNDPIEANQYAQLFFYLGRAAYLKKEYGRAKDLFEKTLHFMPEHRKSKVYLKIIEGLKNLKE